MIETLLDIGSPCFLDFTIIDQPTFLGITLTFEHKFNSVVMPVKLAAWMILCGFWQKMTA